MIGVTPMKNATFRESKNTFQPEISDKMFKSKHRRPVPPQAHFS